MVVCPQCGQENPEGFRICGMCGSSLAAVAPETEERKLISVLFVDLVGHTAASDQADPEDVRARLRPYHQLLKREIERYGGTVEKFVGDAVMAVFGAPVAHEDDAERAIRSALRILEAVEELELEVRAAIATGEAVVSLSARPEQGEGIVAGDVVNTAARLQNEAPPGGLVVGEVTFRATRDAIEYQQLEPVRLKGKADPVPLWRALRARGRFGVDAEAAPRTPFVGREHDLVLLQEAYARAVREQEVQLVTVVGEPGVGKTRLVAEFRSWLDDQPERIRWRQGRCLPYGEGITFWALGEIVKAQAGILESDSPDEAASKLDTAVRTGVEHDPENEWLISRLAPLVGARTEGGSADQGESFTAWRRFLERLAAQRPLVLLFEDLHWADSALFDFLDELVEWGSEVSLLVVCTARPELYELNQGWGGGKRNSTTVSLSPLTTDETARLVSALLERVVLPAETQAALLERAGGNPLYAEEFVRMLSDQGILTEHGELAGSGEIALPETVHALIAARLDTLAPEPKALLHDASVVGKVFWPGAVASIGRTERAAVRERLRELVRKELVRPARVSSVEAEEEFSFWHALVRDVAYGQIPRAARVEKHRAAAGWIEQTAGERVADHAELIAHHYEHALELARATGNDETAELEARAARFLTLAGERSFHLEPRRSYDYFCRALELTPEDDGDRPELLAAVARAARAVVDNAQVLRHWEEAVSAFRTRGDPVEAAWALAQMSGIAWQSGDTARSESLFAEALELVEGQPASPKVADIYARVASQDALFGRPRECLESSRRALRIADQLGLEDVKLKALQFRGAARLGTGDAAGIDDLRIAVKRGLELGLARDTDVAYANLGSWLWPTEGPAKALANHLEGIEFAERRGLAGALWKRAETVWFLFDLGQWDDLLEVTRDPRPVLNQMDVLVLAYKAHVLAYRGAVREAGGLLGQAVVERAREIDDPQVLFAVLPIAALIAQLQGDLATALALTEEYRDGHARRYFFELLTTCVRVCVEARAWDLARELIAQEAETILTRNRNSRVHARAILAEGQGELDEAEQLYADSVARWAAFGFVLEHGQALFGRGRCLVALGRADEAASDLREARKTFAGLGASSLVAEVDGLLPQAAVG